MKYWIVIAALPLFLIVPAFGQNAPAPANEPADPRLTPPPDKLELKEGDTIVFLGDSITHQCLYTQYIEDYYYTRFPGTHLHFHNSGVGGDRAQDALDRFDMDVAAYKPKYVTILLGMNDGGYKQWDAATFETYQKGMLELLDKIKGIGATAIVMGPTMYDRDSLLLRPKDKARFDGPVGKYYNAVLAYYGSYMRDQAHERGLPYVDMFAALNDIYAQARLKEPNFTMIPDGVHPDPNGQTIMATSFLETVNVPHQVSVTIAHRDSKEGWKVAVTPGGNVSDIQGDADHLSFTSDERCIPWILPPEAAVGYKLSTAGHHDSIESLQIQGLAPGNYELKIDGQQIGVFASGLLASRIELQNFNKTPQYMQGVAVAELNKEKNDKATHPIRDLYGRLKGVRHDKKTTPESLNAFIEEMKPKVAKLEELEADYNRKIYEAAQPKSHKIELTRASEN